MMENSRCKLLDDKRFKEALDERYFHPSRKYASEEIKFIARNAMLLLWDMDGISVQGIHFSKSDIRYRMLGEMTCEDLDRAIAEASARKWNMKFVDEKCSDRIRARKPFEKSDPRKEADATACS